MLENTGSGAKAGALDDAVLDADFSGLPVLAIVRLLLKKRKCLPSDDLFGFFTGGHLPGSFKTSSSATDEKRALRMVDPSQEVEGYVLRSTSSEIHTSPTVTSMEAVRRGLMSISCTYLRECDGRFRTFFKSIRLERGH